MSVGRRLHIGLLTRVRLLTVSSPAEASSAPSGRRSQGVADDRLRLLQDAAQVVRPAEALGVDLVDVLGARRPRGEPAALGHHLHAADRRAVAGRRGEDGLDRLAGQVAGRGCRGRQRRQQRLLRRAWRAPRCGRRPARRTRASARGRARRDRGPVRAVISAASSAGTMPSLSVVQTLPSRRRNDAPALSSPPKPERAVEQAVHEPLEADRHLVEPCGRASRRRGRSSRCSPRSCRPPRSRATAGRCWNR